MGETTSAERPGRGMGARKRRRFVPSMAGRIRGVARTGLGSEHVHATLPLGPTYERSLFRGRPSLGRDLVVPRGGDRREDRAPSRPLPAYAMLQAACCLCIGGALARTGD